MKSGIMTCIMDVMCVTATVHKEYVGIEANLDLT
jgi:hypothetical protein